MRKTLLYIPFVLAVAISVASCINVVHDNVNVVSFSSKSFDNAPSVSKSLKSFAAIINNGPLNIEYHQSDKYGITILGDTGKADCVRAEVVDGELRLRLEPGVYHDLWLKVLVQAPALSVIHQNGSGDISCDVLDRKPTVDLKTNGSGEIEISTIDCRDLYIAINGRRISETPTQSNTSLYNYYCNRATGVSEIVPDIFIPNVIAANDFEAMAISNYIMGIKIEPEFDFSKYVTRECFGIFNPFIFVPGLAVRSVWIKNKALGDAIYSIMERK